MNKHMICKVFLAFSLFLCQTAKGQNDFDSTFIWLFQNVSSLHGNVFLDTTYEKVDTAQLRATYGEQLTDELEVVRIYQMKLVDFNFNNLPSDFQRVKTVKDFYKEKYRPAANNSTDSLAIVKFEQLSNSIQRFMSNEQAFDSIRRAETLLFKSSFHERLAADQAKGTPKRMKILSVFEGEKVYLVVYQFMTLYGYPHYYVKSELVLK